MKVKQAIELLSELPEDDEICAQWYSRQDVEGDGEPISEEVWIKANRLMDRWSFSEFIELIEDAVAQSRREQ